MDETKLTITLSGRAIETLNHLMETSGFGSRGRTIEEAILAVDDLTKIGDQLLPILVQLGAQNPTQEQSMKFINSLNAFIVYYIASTSRFRKLVRPPTVSPSPSVVPDAKSIGGRQPG